MVEEATNSDKWGPHGTLMADITKRSFYASDYKQILGILARRLHSEPRYWRQIYKSLLLLEYMAKNGPDRMVSELKSNGKVFSKLQGFCYVDSEGRDQGMNIRNRAKLLWDLVHDDEGIQAERTRATKLQLKTHGTSTWTGTFTPSEPVAPTTPPIVAHHTPNHTPREAPAPAAADRDSEAAKADVEDPGHFQEALDMMRKHLESFTTRADKDAENGEIKPCGKTGGAWLPTVKPKPRLSEIKVDSNMAAMFQNFPVKDPPVDAPTPQMLETDAPNAVAGGNLLDIGGSFLESPPPPRAEPAPAPAPSSQAVPGRAPVSNLLGDSLDGAAQGASADEWDDFAEASAAGGAAATAVDALAADPFAGSDWGTPVAAATQPAAAAAKRGPLLAADFCSPGGDPAVLLPGVLGMGGATVAAGGPGVVYGAAQGRIGLAGGAAPGQQAAPSSAPVFAPAFPPPSGSAAAAPVFAPTFPAAAGAGAGSAVGDLAAGFGGASGGNDDEFGGFTSAAGPAAKADAHTTLNGGVVVHKEQDPFADLLG